jgi:hypothetical protein
MHLLESASFNKGKNKIYNGVAGNLVAYACKVSFQHGNDGFVSFTSKTQLISHYENTLGAYHFINKVCIESLVNLSNIEDTNSYENLINLCISHLEFINKLKFIRSSNYLKNNPIEQIFNKYSNKLINQIQLYKFSVHIKNIVFNEEEINKLNEIQLKLEKRAWFKVPNVIHRIGRKRSNFPDDDESMIMNSFYNGTSENFGF